MKMFGKHSLKYVSQKPSQLSLLLFTNSNTNQNTTTQQSLRAEVAAITSIGYFNSGLLIWEWIRLTRQSKLFEIKPWTFWQNPFCFHIFNVVEVFASINAKYFNGFGGTTSNSFLNESSLGVEERQIYIVSNSKRVWKINPKVSLWLKKEGYSKYVSKQSPGVENIKKCLLLENNLSELAD